MGSDYIKLVKLLYRHPTAQVQTNKDISNSFDLTCSTRQGCCLSPLLFAIAIEPLATAIRANPAIRGIQAGGRTHTLSLYADDILAYLSSPDASIPALMEALEEFGQVSGYKVNVNKSVIMPLNARASVPPPNLAFKWSPDHITYLGLQVPNKLKNTFSLNYVPLLQKTKADCEKWTSLPFTLVGRVNCIKMNILPKYLYLFQMLPTPIPKHFFKQLHTCLRGFIWRNKAPRIKLTALQLPTEMGGMKSTQF